MRLTLRNLANKLFNAASLQRISVAERKDMREAALRLEELFDTLHELYYATAWVPTSKVDNAQELWTKVRDLCGFEPGQSPPLPVTYGNLRSCLLGWMHEDLRADSERSTSVEQGVHDQNDAIVEARMGVVSTLAPTLPVEDSVQWRSFRDALATLNAAVQDMDAASDELSKIT